MPETTKKATKKVANPAGPRIIERIEELEVKVAKASERIEQVIAAVREGRMDTL